MKIYFEATGGGRFSKEETPKVFVRAYVQPQKNGSAYMYDSIGKKHNFFWVNTRRSKSYEEEELPEEMVYSIKHGSCNMHINIENENIWKKIDIDSISKICKALKIKTTEQFISILKYEKVDKKETEALIEILQKIQKIKSIDDFKVFYKNNDHIKQVMIPKVVDKVLELANIPKSKIINGELGLAYFNDIAKYKTILKTWNLQTLF